MKRLYQVWAVPLDSNWHQLINQGGFLLALHQKCHTPYYWDRKNFYVFSSETALELEMAGRDFSVWMRMF